MRKFCGNLGCDFCVKHFGWERIMEMIKNALS